MTNRAAKTGPDAIALVAVEQGFAPGERILTDELAGPMLPLLSRAWIRAFRPLRRWLVATTENRAPGLWGGIMARKRFIDDAVAADPCNAVVNLGAGYDTRAYRLPELADVPVWEVDLPENLGPKHRRLRRIFGEVPAHVTLVPTDFERDELAAALAQHGYPPHTTTFFIWEGVTQYLSAERVHSTLAFLEGAPPESRLVFTYTPKDFIDGNNLYGQPYLFEKMVGSDPIWHFGLDPRTIDDLLAEYGWRVVEHLGYDELGARYVEPTGRELDWMAIERLVHARKR